MYSLKENIFGYFGRHAKRNDTYKDTDGKGIWERYNEAIGEDFDENNGALINNFMDNLLNPFTAEAKFIPYLEGMFGNLVKIYDTIEFRRKVLSFATRILAIKGTPRSYVMLLKMAGFTSVAYAEDFSGSGFDSPVTLDDPERVFDAGVCPTCSSYTLTLTGAMPMDAELKGVISNIINFVEPINARLKQIIYNGEDITTGIISIAVDEYGNLSYNNDNDTGLTLKLVKGNLMVVGSNASRYFIDENGNFKFRL